MFWAFFKKKLPEDMSLFDFRERVRERERKRNIGCESKTLIGCLLCALTGDWNCNLGMCSDYELNMWPFSVWDYIPSNWTTLARAMFRVSMASFFIRKTEKETILDSQSTKLICIWTYECMHYGCLMIKYNLKI